MHPETARELEAFLARRAPDELASGSVEHISFDRQMELLWPIAEMFGKISEALRAIAYDLDFEGEADEIVRTIADQVLDIKADGSGEAMRIVLERLTQNLTVIAANMAAGKPGIAMPRGLPDPVLRGALLYFWIVRGRLLKVPA